MSEEPPKRNGDLQSLGAHMGHTITAHQQRREKGRPDGHGDEWVGFYFGDAISRVTE